MREHCNLIDRHNLWSEMEERKCFLRDGVEITKPFNGCGTVRAKRALELTSNAVRMDLKEAGTDHVFILEQLEHRHEDLPKEVMVLPQNGFPQ